MIFRVFISIFSYYFKGTGSLNESGKGNGKNYTINVPLESGVDDRMFFALFSSIFNKIIENYKPEVIVVQCGGDALHGDPIDLKNQFNLTTTGYCECVKLIINKNIPSIFLGGGMNYFKNN